MNNIFYQEEESAFSDFLSEQKYTQYILLADANTNGFCIPLFKKLLPQFNTSSLIVIPQGESNKNLATCNLIWSELDRLRADRSSVLINIGGGMISDIGGFAASVYKRGIDFMNIPTTLLSMVDACYGGKTAIDFNNIKNNIGTFQHPKAIYIQTSFLKTLDHSILKSGIAETIKHALISSADWWHQMIQFQEQEFYSLATIQKSLQIKVALVMQDERDYGIRQTLNFGHTIGHAIESYSLTTAQPLLHGEAILLGMIHELKISEDLFNLDPTILIQLLKLKETLFPNLIFNYTFHDIKPFLKHDKKNKDGIRMSLLNELGNCDIHVLVSDENIESTFTS